MQSNRRDRTGDIRRALLALALALPMSACGQSSAPTPAEAPPAAVAALEAVKPTGSYAVGVSDLTATAGLPLWLFYPADGTAAAGQPPALPETYGVALARRFGPAAAGALLKAPGHAAWDAPAAKGKAPVLVFSPGASMGARDYRMLFEELASQGYVVAAVNPLGSPPVSENRYSDAANEVVRTANVLRDLARQGPWSERLDTSRIGFFGHSIGGASVVLALSRDPQTLAAANLDGDYSGASNTPAPARPILYLVGRTDGETEASRARRKATWTLVSNGSANAVAVQLPTLRHFDFADAALLPPSVIPENRRRNRFGAIDGARAHALTSHLLVAFFDQALRGKPGALKAAIDATPEASRDDAF